MDRKAMRKMLGKKKITIRLAPFSCSAGRRRWRQRQRLINEITRIFLVSFLSDESKMCANTNQGWQKKSIQTEFGQCALELLRSKLHFCSHAMRELVCMHSVCWCWCHFWKSTRSYPFSICTCAQWRYSTCQIFVSVAEHTRQRPANAQLKLNSIDFQFAWTACWLLFFFYKFCCCSGWCMW